MPTLTIPQIVEKFATDLMAYVTDTNPGATPNQITAAYDRAFPIAWDKFRTHLHHTQPAKAAHFERQLTAYLAATS